MYRHMLTEGDIERLLKEDAPAGDITSRAVCGDAEATGDIVAKEAGVVAGLEEAGQVFRHAGAKYRTLAQDGNHVKTGDTVARVEGRAYDLLLAERLALNLAMRMSGIATATARCAERARKTNPDARVAATRKTVPGLRTLDKKAVRLGGGDPHRLDLSHAYLVKENHAAITGLREAAQLAVEDASFTQKVEVEVESIEEALEVADLGVDVLLLDNFSPEETHRCAEKLDKKMGPSRPLLEASGNITEENVADYAAHVEIVSMGWLTHSAPALDLSMRIRPAKS